jgi:uncharacterized oligopeptide transporter (OPT) family protein
MVPNQAELLKFPAPATRQWEAVAKVLTKGIDQLPQSAQWAILIGALVGIRAPRDREAHTLQVPLDTCPPPWASDSRGSFPFSSAIGFFIGAVVGWIWSLIHRKSSDKFSVGLACGCIAGESLMKAILAMTATAIFLMTPKSQSATAAPAPTPATVVAPAPPAPLRKLRLMNWSTSRAV